MRRPVDEGVELPKANLEEFSKNNFD